MPKKKFEICSTDTITEKTLIKINLHITTLSYLEKQSFYLIELSNSGTTKLNGCIIGLNTPITIPDNDQQLNLPESNYLKVEQIKKKKKRLTNANKDKISLAQANFSTSISAFLFIATYILSAGIGTLLSVDIGGFITDSFLTFFLVILYFLLLIVFWLLLLIVFYLRCLYLIVLISFYPL